LHGWGGPLLLAGRANWSRREKRTHNPGTGGRTGESLQPIPTFPLIQGKKKKEGKREDTMRDWEKGELRKQWTGFVKKKKKGRTDSQRRSAEEGGRKTNEPRKDSGGNVEVCRGGDTIND